jgi:hypothetical protein
VDATAAQPRQLPEAQPSAEQGGDVVPPEQRETGQQPAGLLRGERAAPHGAEHLLGVGAASGRRHPASRVGLDRAFVGGELQDAQQ